MVEFWQQTLSGIHWQLNGAMLLAWCAAAFWLWLIWPTAELRVWLGDRAAQRRTLVALLAVTALWLMHASVQPAMQLHFLALVTLMLMLGWRLATVLLLLPASFYCLLVLKSPAELGALVLLGFWWPLFIAFVFYNRCFHILPKHLFVFIFCGAFINAGLSQLSHELLWGLWLWWGRDYQPGVIWDNYWQLAPLLAFPEALLNGMAVTLLVVYKPEWLADYSDRVYLWKK
ncbi:hypothetical protein [Shewanella sedimentimangrovi]|uniref:Integral membrane protein n=1 Tax=Shewanella sedimentimangrovi TaxID=2814293 RepID=A0ABX7R7F1_9GAMM|nr:hypothetical protein JYB85_10535 [Shewanella sedimentimangrovi]